MSANLEKELVVPDGKHETYATYLKVNELLRLQKLKSEPPEHDEMLFIIIHQVYELWFKQIIHEMQSGIAALRADKLLVFLSRLKRVATIQDTLTKQVDVLETMTPTDFNRFRDRLGPASGFQSHQFRQLEFMLGLKHSEYLRFYKHAPDQLASLEEAIANPSIYDEFLAHLARAGYNIPDEVSKRDITKPYTANDTVTETLLQVYRQPSDHYELYTALEQLIDYDQKFILWRYRHVSMVSRMIGSLRGTGDSSGVKYLTSTLTKQCFPEIWLVRDYLKKDLSK